MAWMDPKGKAYVEALKKVQAKNPDAKGPDKKMLDEAGETAKADYAERKNKKEAQMNKIAQAQETLFNEVYVPALVGTLNEKAAAFKLPLIKTSEDLQAAIALVNQIRMAKQAANVKTKSGLEKAAASKDQNSQVYMEIVRSFAKEAASNGNTLNAVLDLLEAK